MSIDRADHLSNSQASAGKQDRERAGPMIATRLGVDLGRAADFTVPDRPDRLCICLVGKHPMLRIPAELEQGNKDRLLPIAPGFEVLVASDVTADGSSLGARTELTRLKTPLPIRLRVVQIAKYGRDYCRR